MIILESEREVKICDQLKNYIYDSCSDINKHGYVDFVAIGNVGCSYNAGKDKYLGSVANAILRMKKLNTLFVS